MPNGHELRSPCCPPRRALRRLLTTHAVYWQVPGLNLARDQIASIATGTCCAECGGTARDRLGNRGVAGRTIAVERVQLDKYRLLVIDDKLLDLGAACMGAEYGLCMQPRDHLTMRRQVRLSMLYRRSSPLRVTSISVGLISSRNPLLVDNSALSRNNDQVQSCPKSCPSR